MQKPTTHQSANLGSKSIPTFKDQNYLLYLSQAITFHLVKISISEKLTSFNLNISRDGQSVVPKWWFVQKTYRLNCQKHMSHLQSELSSIWFSD